jgi:hypothetical protein
MMPFIRFVLLATTPCLLAAAPVARGEDDPASKEPTSEPLLLRDAIERGLVEASGHEPAAYRLVTLHIESRSKGTLSLDLAGSHLKNRTGTPCQGLGLGPPVDAAAARPDGHGRLLVELASGEKKDLRLQSVCLDAGAPCPSNQQFEVVRSPLPDVREKVLRWWMDNPGAPQGAVNSAIWQFRDTVEIGPGKVEDYATPKGTFGVLHAGTAYRLRNGELLSRDPDGIVRFIGTGLFQALPTTQGLYAVGSGAGHEPELWRYSLTGENPWGRVAALDAQMRIQSVLPAGSDRLVLVTDHGVSILDVRSGRIRKALEKVQVLDVSAIRAGEDVVTVVLRVPGAKGVFQGGQTKGEQQDVFEIWKVSLNTVSEERLKRYWNVESVVAGRAGVFGLTHVGRIRVLVGDEFHNLPVTDIYARLLAVGTDVLWVCDAAGHVVAADPRTGARLHGGAATYDDLTAVSVDAATGDLALVKGERFLRVKAKDGTIDEFDARPVEGAPPVGGR